MAATVSADSSASDGQPQRLERRLGRALHRTRDGRLRAAFSSSLALGRR